MRLTDKTEQVTGIIWFTTNCFDFREVKSTETFLKAYPWYEIPYFGRLPGMVVQATSIVPYTEVQMKRVFIQISIWRILKIIPLF